MGKKNRNADYDLEGCQRLAAAVVEITVHDYKSALRRLHRRPENHVAKKMVEDCESFFRDEMGIYSNLDGEDIMKKIRKKVLEEVQDG